METVVAPDGAGRRAGLAPVIVYTSDTCHWCGKVKQFLTAQGVAYTERNASRDPAAAAELIARTGQDGVPVIVVGETLVLGFRRPQLEALLGLAPDAAGDSAGIPSQDVAPVVDGPLPPQLVALGQIVSLPALSHGVGAALGYDPGRCDHTFQHTAAFLAPHAAAAGMPLDAALDLIRQLGARCDCEFGMNVCGPYIKEA
ncbi:MAG TPA: glutaredoxin family protein [Chloroflexia bacterium]|nr:glutaredoxin family protein [Chloroflexia bacterium]